MKTKGAPTNENLKTWITLRKKWEIDKPHWEKKNEAPTNWKTENEIQNERAHLYSFIFFKPYFLHYSHSPPWDNNKLNFALGKFLFLKCFNLQMLPIKKIIFFPWHLVVISHEKNGKKRWVVWENETHAPSMEGK
jgi:hypothetical protein